MPNQKVMIEWVISHWEIIKNGLKRGIKGNNLQTQKNN